MEGGAVSRPRRQSAFAKAASIRHAKMRDGMKALKVARVAGVKFSIRSAAKLVNVPFSTFRDYHENCIRDKPREPQNMQLTMQEEKDICELLLRYQDLGRPLTSTDLCDAVEMLVQTFPAERREKLRFVNGRPGRAFLRGFNERHREILKYAHASPQESVRFSSTNATVLTEYFGKVERIITEHGIDESRICNLDESGFTPNRDQKRAQNPKVFGRRGQKAQLIERYFSNDVRVTMMAVSFSDGTLGKPLFVFGGSKLRYRTVLSGEGQRTESILDSLPPGAVARTRDGAPGVDSAIFLRYMQSFVHDVRERTSNGRKVLLLYDAYRPHMSIDVLELLRANNIIAFALPAHTSGTTQPLDVSCFSPWKKKARSYIRAMSTNALVAFDEFDMCRILSRAYCHSFTPANVQAGFRKAGVCPLDANKLIGMPRVRSAADLSTVVDSKAMFAMLEERRVAVATAVGIQPQVAAHGFIDTSHGVNLTAPEAMDIVRKKEEHRRMKKIAEKQKQLKAEEERYGKRRHREHIEMFALRTRARVGECRWSRRDRFDIAA